MNQSISVGDRFGRWTVAAFSHRDKWSNPYWFCRCECGTEKVIQGSSLRRGDTRSCGCLHRDRFRTHGLKGSPEYQSWKALKKRCTNSKYKNYKDYGGRGITVCDRWNNFENFLADMGPKPTPQHSIDRIDNDGPYSPDNCRWATRKEQGRNQRTNRLLTHNGRTMPLSAWAEETGKAESTIWTRLKAGWSVERVLTEPVDERFSRRPCTRVRSLPIQSFTESLIEGG